MSTLTNIFPRSAAPPIQPPRLRWVSRLLVPVLILGGAAAVLLYSGWRSLRGATTVEVVPAVAKPIDPGQPAAGADPGESGAPVVQAPGWIEPDPFPVYVPALTEGVVSEVMVLEGQRVHAGDVVARLIDADARLTLAGAEAEVVLATAELASARADLQAAQTDWDNPVERTRALAVAEAAVAETSADLARHDAEVTAEEARLEEVKDEFERISKSSAMAAVSASESAKVRLRLAAQERALEATRAHRPVLEATLRQREAELAAAREALRLRVAERRALETAGAAVGRAEAHLRQDEAARDEAALRLERTQVRSPVSGVVMMRMVEPGSRIMMISDDPHASHIARLYDPERLQVRVDIPLAEAAKVGVGQRAEIITEALPDQVFRGVVTRRVDQADIQKNTVQVKVAIESPLPILRPEMLARVRFFGAASARPSGTPAASPSAWRVFIPEATLVDRRETSAHVWAVDQRRGVATRRAVTLGPSRLQGWVEVTDGVRPGDRVISASSATLREGAAVRVTGERAGEPAPSPSHTGGHP